MKLQYRLLIFIILLIWFAGIFFGALISADGNFLFIYPFIRKSYSLVCHQNPSKCFHSGSVELFVCARCTGIYAGLLAASAAGLFKTFRGKIPLKVFILFSLPMLLDVILYSAGVYTYSKITALITGVFFGSAGFSYFYAGINDLLNEIHQRK